MATTEEILKKAKSKKKPLAIFKPKKRRSWDFVFEKNEQKEAHTDIIYKQNNNNIGTNKEQSSNNIGTNKEQSSNNIGTNKEQSSNEYSNNIVTKQRGGFKQNKVKVLAEESQEPYIMQGIQNKVLRHIISHIKNQPTKINFVNISINILSKKINASKDSVRTSINRLQKKNLLLKTKGDKGRYGNTKIKLASHTLKKYFELFNDPPCDINEYKKAENPTIWEQYSNKYNNNVAYSSSSSSSIETTTTKHCKNTKNVSLSTEWENLDIEPLASIGFTKTHLSQIAYHNKLAPQTVQDSIYSFAFDLQENNKEKTIKGDPINFFMGILSAGRVYTFASNYESPQDRSLRLYAESKRKIEQKRIELEKEAIALAFNEWFTTLTQEQKRSLLPEMFRNTPRLEKNKLLESSARTHFEAEVWPNQRSEIMQTDKKNTIEPKEVITEETKA